MHCYETCVMIEIHFSLKSKWKLREKTKSNGKHYVMRKGRDKKQEGEKKKNDWFVLFVQLTYQCQYLSNCMPTAPPTQH